MSASSCEFNSVLRSNMLSPSFVEISLFHVFGFQPPLEIRCTDAHPSSLIGIYKVKCDCAYKNSNE